jgi:hypothetical protein
MAQVRPPAPGLRVECSMSYGFTRLSHLENSDRESEVRQGPWAYGTLAYKFTNSMFSYVTTIVVMTR